MNFFSRKNKETGLELENNFSNPSVLEVNLIKDEMAVDFEWNKRVFSLLLSLFVSALFVTEIYLGLDWWQKQEEKKAVSLQNNYERLSKEVQSTKAKAEEVMIFRDKLGTVQKMMDNHIYWTNFFSWLEKNTFNSVSYGGSFAGDISGSYLLSATAKTYSDISWQAKHFKNDKYVVRAAVSSGSMGGGKEDEDKARQEDDKKGAEEEKVSFSLDLEVKPEIFFR